MNVDVIVMRDGDGWLSVDTERWIEEKLGERDDELTDDLREWTEANGVSWTRCTAPADWARARFGEVQGPDGDNIPFLTNSANQDNILSDDLCVMLMRVREEEANLTIAVVNHDEVFVLAPVQEWSDVIDWSRAYGQCESGHHHIVEGGCYLHREQNSGTYRLTELCREGDDAESGYVACPDCGQPLRFMA